MFMDSVGQEFRQSTECLEFNWEVSVTGVLNYVKVSLLTSPVHDKDH